MNQPVERGERDRGRERVELLGDERLLDRLLASPKALETYGIPVVPRRVARIGLESPPELLLCVADSSLYECLEELSRTYRRDSFLFGFFSGDV